MNVLNLFILFGGDDGSRTRVQIEPHVTSSTV